MPANLMPLDVCDAQSWSFTSQGRYEPRADRRALLAIIHPWTMAADGDFGMLAREVTIPADWQPPYRIRFYCCDDYVNDDWRPKPEEWLGGEGFSGHRFKQVLVNGKVVWERDVADAEGPQATTRFEVDLTGLCAPGKPFRLGLRVLDKVSTETTLPGDFHHIGTTETHAEKPGDPAGFMTHVYWGDVFLLHGEPDAAVLAPFERRPSEAAVEAVHAKRWPLPPFGATRAHSAALNLQLAEGIPPGGFPVTCGVPLPAGVAKDLGQIELRDPDGGPLPIQAAVLNRWQDGSLRWVLVDFAAPAGAAARGWRLQVHPPSSAAKRGRTARPPAPEHLVKISRRAGNVRVATGAMTLLMGGRPAHLIEAISLPSGATVAGPLTGEVIVRKGRRDLRYEPRVEQSQVTAGGPLRATVEMRGRLINTEDRKDSLGRFLLRVHAYAGQPILRVFYRLFNDTAEPLRIKRFGLTLATTGKPQALLNGEPANLPPGKDLTITQTTADACVLRQGKSTRKGSRSQGWIAVGNDQGTVVVAVRDFWQLFPKALRAHGDAIDADLFAPTGSISYFEPTPGEAKRHEVLLAFLPPDASRDDIAAIVGAFARPPRLFSAEWFCESGGLGYAAPHSDTEFADLHRQMVKAYSDVNPTILGGAPGIRDFPDSPYQGKPGKWRNNYYDVMQGEAAEYLIGGDPRWFDRLEDQCLHVMDADTCHGRLDHPEWLGVLYGPGGNHSDSWWSAMLRAEGMDSYYRLSGDPDALDAFLGVADFVARQGAGMGSVSVRDHAGALIALVSAYDETWDPKYLQAAGRLAHDALSRIDRRRGCYSEVHGNYNYRGNVPWMCAQLMEPLYLYYRQSGDLDVANAVVGLAESLVTENTTGKGPGDFYGYSHNPHFHATNGYNVLIAPAIGYAWELTGDPAFAECMRDAYQRTIAEGSVNAVVNCYWNTPTLLHYLNAMREAPAQAPKRTVRR